MSIFDNKIVKTYKNTRTFENYRSTLNKVNEHYGWDKDMVYFDRLNNNAKDIAVFIYKVYRILNTEQYKQKMSALSSFMKRTGFDDRNNISMMVKNGDKYLSVVSKENEKLIEDWETLQPKLKELGQHNSVIGIIARIFSYGYVLRVGEMFETRIDEDNGVDNYLDLKNCRWNIRKQKNGTAKEFDVDPQLCKELLDYFDRVNKVVSIKWLLSKSATEKYGQGSHKLRCHGWTLQSNNDIRKSYETWNRHRSGRTEEEKQKWHVILGHSVDTVKKSYDTLNFEPEPEPVKKRIKVKIKRKYPVH